MTKYNLPVEYNKLSSKERIQVREQYIKKQNNLCFYCNQSLESQPPLKIRSMPIDWRLFPPNFLKYPVHLQHNHFTGLTEWAVHSYCNAVLWQYHGR